MSKKNIGKKKNRQNHPKKKAASAAKTVNWRKWIKSGTIALGFIGAIVASLMAYSHKLKIEHDLSVIGNGKATVVQIHDPNCPSCRRLKSNLDSVKGEFKEEVQFKTANISTRKGRRFAAQHNVPHVTLLFFNESGRHVNTLQGVTPEEEIRIALNRLSRR